MVRRGRRFESVRELKKTCKSNYFCCLTRYRGALPYHLPTDAADIRRVEVPANGSDAGTAEHLPAVEGLEVREAAGPTLDRLDLPAREASKVQIGQRA
jgi:hypothetical protein